MNLAIQDTVKKNHEILNLIRILSLSLFLSPCFYTLHGWIIRKTLRLHMAKCIIYSFRYIYISKQSRHPDASRNCFQKHFCRCSNCTEHFSFSLHKSTVRSVIVIWIKNTSKCCICCINDSNFFQLIWHWPKMKNCIIRHLKQSVLSDNTNITNYI